MRFSGNGIIRAINGGVYTSVVDMTYSAHTTYHVRIVANVVTHTYSAFVRPPVGAEQTIAQNYAFNTLQQGVARLDTRMVVSDRESLTACDFVLNGATGTPPSVAMTAPSPGATLSGTVTLAANASDDTGVAGVQFLVDGTPVGAEDTTAPYSLAFDTTTIANGNHTFAARARDTAGTTATSAAVTASVNNDAPSTGQGQWSAPVLWPAEGVHGHLLPNGKLLLFPHGEMAGMETHVWDPVTNVFTLTPNTRTNVGCSGHAFMPDGRLFVASGEPANAVGLGIGVVDTNYFDFTTNTWTAGPNLNDGRWYANVTALGNGEMAIISGDSDTDVGNPIPQVLTTAGALRTLSSAFRVLPSYSFTHLAPDGRVFVSGPERHSVFLNTAGTGSWSDIVATYKFPNFRSYASSVLYDDGRVIVLGGSNPPTNAAEVINLNAATLAWRNVAPMSVARRHHNATLLPDGTILVSGGTSASGFNNPAGAVLRAEIWNPATETFTPVASMTVPRLYHSIAVLLPDGRVVVTGGKGTGDNVGEERREAEFYSPDYLFRGPRPTITSTPTTVGYGRTFFVGTPNAASINRVTWIRLPSVTHAFDQNQRINRLSFTTTAGGINVTAPTNPNLCPPGHYMLFILNNLGVPSVAQIVRIF